ncbi:hypothetical protein KUIN1_14860 [Pseudomonas sp. KUIN-1]|nr:hypothetical protein KUIN1_14860 [Pseudomonas sp. KUIN-1]
MYVRQAIVRHWFNVWLFAAGSAVIQWRQIGAATVVVGAFWCIGEASREA